MKTRKTKKHIKLNLFNILVLFTALASLYILLHDFVVWGVIPFFTKDYVMLTYSGLALDFIAVCGLDICSRIIKEW